MKKKSIIATGCLALLGGIATAAFVSSCDPDCGANAKPSLIIQTVDGSEMARQAGVEAVWYALDDGPTIAAECANDDCSEWLVGDGEPGDYAIHASVCGEEFVQTVTVEISADGCSLDTEMVRLPVGLEGCELRAPAEPTEPV